MASGEQKIRRTGVVARDRQGNLLGSEEAVARLDDFADTQMALEVAKRMHASRLNEIGEQIAVLLAEKRELQKERKFSTTLIDGLGQLEAEEVIELIADPDSSLPPIYRAAMQAPGVMGGSMWELNTYMAADALGKGLVDLDNQLRQSDTPQPVASFTRLGAPRQPNPALRIDYGYTIPGEGLELGEGPNITEWVASRGGMTQFRPQPVVKLPVQYAETIQSSPYNSHYTVSDGRRFELIGHGRRSEGKGEESEIPTPEEEAVINLPTGNLIFDGRPRPLVVYETETGVERILRPGNFERTPNSLYAIGDIAVRQGIIIGHSRSMEFGFDPDLTKDMVCFVASALEVAVDRNQFKQIKKKRRKEPALV